MQFGLRLKGCIIGTSRSSSLNPSLPCPRAERRLSLGLCAACTVHRAPRWPGYRTRTGWAPLERVLMILILFWISMLGDRNKYRRGACSSSLMTSCIVAHSPNSHDRIISRRYDHASCRPPLGSLLLLRRELPEMVRWSSESSPVRGLGSVRGHAFSA